MWLRGTIDRALDLQVVSREFEPYPVVSLSKKYYPHWLAPGTGMSVIYIRKILVLQSN